MLAAHLTAYAETCQGGEGGGEEREITSHPAPFLPNYSNLTHMDWPPWQTEGEERGSLLWEITHLISE